MKRHIPNAITLMNLLSGFFSIVLVFTGHVTGAVYLVLIAAVFDFLDGFSARLLHAWSPLGKQLDSLADMVSFGVAPAAILLQQISSVTGTSDLAETFPGLSFWLLLSPLFLVAGAGLRLARFNIDPEQETHFVGLPTPAMALFIISIPLVREDGLAGWHPAFLENPWVLAGISLLFGYLMICKLPLFSLKFKNKSSAAIIPAIVFAGLSVILFFLFFLKGLFPIIILYIFMALILFIIQPEKK
ncbi:MAG TPA: CDP-diacylglycerol--serine O-phosphatidyltransferase [Bacteroidetes bacterium]|nr:CDP-diacylglycerol--serine O-phosphatidyltransferase [Bacteroidota bacterium]